MTEENAGGDEDGGGRDSETIGPIVSYDWNDNGCSGIVVLMFKEDE